MKLKTLTLLLTYNCNLACDYCFCGRKRKEDITEEDAKKSIDFFMKEADQEVNITFFGGEPLLQVKLIQKLIDYCKETYSDRLIHYSMTTNGVLLTKENVKLITENQISVTLSMDGMRESHDLHRHFVDGTPSWDIIMNNIQQNGLDKDLVVMRLTFTRHNVKELANNVISMHKLGFKYLAYYPAADKDDYYTEEDIQVFNQQIDLLADYAYQCYQENHPIKMMWFNRSIKSHINGGCARCMDGVNQIAITPDGYIFPCNRVDFNDMSLCLGNITDGIDRTKQEWYKGEITKGDPECEDCALKKRCQGCHIENFQLSGKSWQIPWHYCMMNQYVIRKSDELAEKLFAEKNEHFIERYYNGECPCECE